MKVYDLEEELDNSKGKLFDERSSVRLKEGGKRVKYIVMKIFEHSRKYGCFNTVIGGTERSDEGDPKTLMEKLK
jgi:hypothetical protein